MNRLFVLFFILVVSIIVYSEAKEILKNNPRTAANTPAQVEMKPVFKNNTPYNKFENTNIIQNSKQSEPKEDGQLDKNIIQNKQNLKDFQQRRNNDIFK